MRHVRLLFALRQWTFCDHALWMSGVGIGEPGGSGLHAYRLIDDSHGQMSDSQLSSDHCPVMADSLVRAGLCRPTRVYAGLRRPPDDGSMTGCDGYDGYLKSKPL